MKKLPEVTIGIPVFNEEGNIGLLIKNLLNQKSTNYLMQQLIVISDGSTDNTIKVVKRFKNKKIRLIAHKKRMGKARGLNEIIKLFNSDLLLLCDGDILPRDDQVIEKLVAKFNKGSNTSLAIAKTEPMEGITNLEKAAVNFYRVRDSLSKEFDWGNTVYGARAGGMMLKKEFAKKLTIPGNILNDDAFVYLTCKFEGYKSVFVKDSVIWYRIAQTVNDYKKQMTRFLMGGKQFSKYFPEDFLNKEYSVPLSILFKILVKQLYKNPFAYIYLKVINIYCLWNINFLNKRLNPRWSVVKSSKSLLGRRNKKLVAILLSIPIFS